MKILQLILSLLLRVLFYKRPMFKYTKDEIRDYEKIIDDAETGGGTIQYSSNFPKYRFIQYVIDSRNYLIHGSNNGMIEEFSPRKQTLFNGKLVEAVFATNDGIWSVFYAVLDRNKVVNNFRNGSLSVGNSKNRYHYYSLDRLTCENHPWTNGTVYFLLGTNFISSGTLTDTNSSGILFHEWTSETPVKPIAKLEVEPKDFYFINKVTSHDDRESILKTWFLYKMRKKIKFNDKYQVMEGDKIMY